MRYIIAVLGIAGIAVSSLALAAHYAAPAQQIDVLRSGSNWNSAYVNRSSYAEVYRVPVAAVGIAGYALLVKPPYKLHITIGDPDSGDAVQFEKQS